MLLKLETAFKPFSISFFRIQFFFVCLFIVHFIYEPSEMATFILTTVLIVPEVKTQIKKNDYFLIQK